MTYFQQVYCIVARIPYGYVLSYGHIAMLLGNQNASRTVGWAMRHCPDDLPWHRVIRSDGSIALGMYPEIQRGLLEAEGITFLPDGRVNMKEHLCPLEHIESLT